MIGPVGAAALLAVAWLVAQGRRLPGWRVAGLVVVILSVASILLPDPRGFRAKHFANADFTEPFEFSTEFRSRDFTRVDPVLDFSPGTHEIQRAWLNDLARFNFYEPAQPNRERLAYSVQWEGYWWVGTNGDVLGLYMDALDATGELVIDGVRVLTMTEKDGSRTASAAPLRGWHQVVVRVSVPPSSPGLISAGQLIGDQRVPFDYLAVAQKRLAAWQRIGYRTLDVLWMLAKYGIGIWLIALIAWDLFNLIGTYKLNGALAANRSVVVRVFALIAAIESLRFAWPWAWRVMILPGGDDTLTYEWYARHIQIDGVWMPHVQEPFFYQVLYPYFLAGLHGLFGESMFGAMLAQRLFVWFVAWAIMHVATRIHREGIWPAALAFGGVFAFWKVAPIFAKPLNESLYIPLLIGWAIALLAAMRAPVMERAVRAGVIGGLAALTRTTALAAMALALPAAWMAWKPSGRRTKLMTAMLACTVVLVSFIAIRNLVVTGIFKPLPGEFGVTLAGGNQHFPDLPVEINPANHADFYRRWNIDGNVQMVIEYAITAPGPFMRNMFDKALFALGYFELYAPGWGSSFIYMLVSFAGCIGLWTVLRARHVPVSSALLPALIAFSQFAAVVIIYPKGERLILPFHVMFAPYAAIAIERLWTEFASR